VDSGEGIDSCAEGAGWVDGVEGSVGCAAPGEVWAATVWANTASPSAAVAVSKLVIRFITHLLCHTRPYPTAYVAGSSAAGLTAIYVD
jgi:hypothetical protein